MKKTYAMLIIAIAAATASCTWMTTQTVPEAVLATYGTPAEVQEYKDSLDDLSFNARLVNLAKTRTAKEDEAKKAIHSYRVRNQKKAEKEADDIYDTATGTITAKADRKQVKEASDAANALPKTDATRKDVENKINTVSADLDREEMAQKDVKTVWDNDELKADRKTYDMVKAEVDALPDGRTPKQNMENTLAKANEALTTKEQTEAAQTAVDAVYKDDALVGDRNAYNTAVNAVNVLPDGDLKASLNGRLSKANEQLTAQEEAAKKAAEEEKAKKAAEAAQRKAEADAKKAQAAAERAQRKAASQSNAAPAATNNSAPAQNTANTAPAAQPQRKARYTWTSVDGGQSAINKGYLVRDSYPTVNSFFEGEIRCKIGKQIRSLRAGDIVSINGVLYQIDGEIHGNYNDGQPLWASNGTGLVYRIPGYKNDGNVIGIQTCEPPYGGPIVIKYGHRI